MKTLRDLQALRGVACLAVLMLHLGQLEAESAWEYRCLRPVAVGGFAGVDVFFVLSGFIIFHANRGRLGRPRELRPYLLDRLWRIYPTYWACFVVATVLLHWVFTRSYFPGYFRQAVFHLLLVPQATANFAVPQAWTLSYEVMFYVLFGVLFLVPARLAPAALTAWAVAAGVGAAVAPGPGVPRPLMPVSGFALEFLLGCLAAGVLAKGGTVFATHAVRAGVGWATAAAGVLAVCDVTGLPDRAGLRCLAFGVPAALLVYGLAARESAGRPALPAWLGPFGDASYSVYLTHLFVLSLFKLGGVFDTPLSLPGQLAVLAAAAAAMCGVGLATHRLVERPLLRYRKRSKSRPHPAAEVPPAVRRAA